MLHFYKLVKTFIKWTNSNTYFFSEEGFLSLKYIPRNNIYYILYYKRMA